jgi:hypothetical protein
MLIFFALGGDNARQLGASAVRPCEAQLRFVITSDIGGAGWSSPVARQAHNLKVVGSNPTPATKKTYINQRFDKKPRSPDRGFLLC